MAEGIEGDLIGVMVQDLFKLDRAERTHTLIMTPYNRDRKEINERVREELKQQGDLARDEKTCDVFVSKGFTRAMIKVAQYYRIGDVVRFGRDYQAIEAKKGEYARVVTVDAPNGLVHVRKENGVTFAWQPRQHNRVEVYDVEKRALAQGDLVRFTRNGEPFKNGEVAWVKAMEGQTALLQRHPDTHGAWQAVDLSRHRHWDHAYAVTVHAAQGATAQRAILHISIQKADDPREQARLLKNMAKVFGAFEYPNTCTYSLPVVKKPTIAQ